MPLARMTAQQLRDHLSRLEISQQALARMIRVNPVTVRRWVKIDGGGDIPRAVELLLPRLTAAQAAEIIAADTDEALD